MQTLSRSFVPALLGVGATLLVAEFVGINSFVLNRVTVTTYMPAYGWIFPILLFLGVLGVFVWKTKGGWTWLPTLLVAIVAGYGTGVLSCLLAPLLGGQLDASMYAEAVHFGGRPQFLVLAALSSTFLLSWLYGGVAAGLGLLGERLIHKPKRP